MSNISNTYSKMGAAYEQQYANKAKEADKTKSNEAASTSKIPGKTIGQPTLSDKAKKYYDELRSKYHNMEFILVSEDEKENAKAKAASYAQKNKMVVLIDEAKVERMAEDSAFRSQYEGLIDKAASGFSAFASQVASTGANVKGYGMQVNDNGTVSFFAVLEKSSKAQSERIAKKQAEKKAEKKAEAKKAEKEKAKERLEETREKGKAERNEKLGEDSEQITITANSIEELLQKIQDHVSLELSDNVLTEAEKNIGQNIDFSA